MPEDLAEKFFDEIVSLIRAHGIAPKHKPYGLNKAQCTPAQWAAHREWAKQYESQPVVKAARKKWAARSLARRSKR